VLMELLAISLVGWWWQGLFLTVTALLLHCWCRLAQQKDLPPGHAPVHSAARLLELAVIFCKKYATTSSGQLHRGERRDRRRVLAAKLPSREQPRIKCQLNKVLQFCNTQPKLSLAFLILHFHCLPFSLSSRASRSCFFRSYTARTVDLTFCWPSLKLRRASSTTLSTCSGV
jgi:hypothetical protein